MRQNATTMDGMATEIVFAVGLGEGGVEMVWLPLVVSGAKDVRVDDVNLDLMRDAGRVLV